ncbi:hypothetical protein [Halomonas korlensis]|uniref:Uncharacterized protein n=1 Tax=Halomonas korlensis TaxID=463301 RepID=A0A1I7J3L4_9GAMM|nr:hypothetical protein [Halomonas korlensis]SFU79754.1 hypothetical protein SAMN04487955_10936 [Halomonas korlensis]
MATTETIITPVSRAPRGCNRPVMAHLTESERNELEGLAQREMRSLSATARMLLLRGIEQYQTESAVAD